MQRCQGAGQPERSAASKRGQPSACRSKGMAVELEHAAARAHSRQTLAGCRGRSKTEKGEQQKKKKEGHFGLFVHFVIIRSCFIKRSMKIALALSKELCIELN